MPTGLVTLRHREPGEIVGPGAPVVTLIDPADRWVRIYIPERRIGAVQPGDRAEISTDTVLRIETLVYSLERDTLLWAGTSRTVNPDKVSEFVPEVADTAAREMMKQGVLVRSDGSGSRSRVASP